MRDCDTKLYEKRKTLSKIVLFLSSRKELTEVKEEILRLSEKYSLKCVEASKLEETISYLKTQLNEAKRRILDLEGSEVQSIISCASASSKVIISYFSTCNGCNSNERSTRCGRKVLAGDPVNGVQKLEVEILMYNVWHKKQHIPTKG